jgi:hypothetical protein
MADSSEGLTKSQEKAAESREKYLSGLQEELYALTATVAQKERMKALNAGLVGQDVESAVALRQEREAKQEILRLDDEIAAIGETAGETAARRARQRGSEAAELIGVLTDELTAKRKAHDETKRMAEEETRLAKSLKESTRTKEEAAAERVRQANVLAEKGLIDESTLKATVRKEAKGLVGNIPFGAPADAVKGSAKAQEIIVRQAERSAEVALLSRMEDHLRKLASKPAVEIEEIDAP